MGNATSFTEDIQALGDYQDPLSSLICYQVEATETPNMYNIQGRSLSNRICFSITPDIRMPNAFIPNDSDPLNQRFEPVFSFVPERYEITVYNRLGSKIWQGTEPWDGTVNGKFVPEGVYVYHLRVYNYSTEITEMDGQVTVVYR
jgi:gliding motility-associated-like protein